MGALSALFLVGPAYAHNSLTGSTPAKGAKIADPPEAVTLRFLAKVNEATLKVTVTGPDGVDAGDGDPRVKGAVVTVPWTPGAAGEYAVAYTLGSSDGHPIKGSVTFTLTEGVEPSVEPSVAPTTGAPTEAPSSAAPVPNQALEPTAGDRADDGAPVWPWVLGAVVLVAAGATGAAVVRRRRTAG